MLDSKGDSFNHVYANIVITYKFQTFCELQIQLSQAEQRMNKLDQCYCERTCTIKGMTYREFESWTDGCKNCTCMVWLQFERRPKNLDVSSDCGFIGAK